MMPLNRRHLGLPFLALIISTSALAEVPPPSVIGLHLYSRHEPAPTVAGNLGWNNRNFGIYARWPDGLTLGAYNNSLFAPSAYAAWTWETREAKLPGLHISAALTAGVVSGYDVMKADSRNGPIPAELRTAVRCDAQGCRQVGVRRALSPLVAPSVRIGLTECTSARLTFMPKFGADGARAIHLSIERRF